jgi:hypothetical protein
MLAFDIVSEKLYLDISCIPHYKHGGNARSQVPSGSKERTVAIISQLLLGTCPHAQFHIFSFGT